MCNVMQNAKAMPGTILVIKLNASEQEIYVFISDGSNWEIIYWRVEN